MGAAEGGGHVVGPAGGDNHVVRPVGKLPVDCDCGDLADSIAGIGRVVGAGLHGIAVGIHRGSESQGACPE